MNAYGHDSERRRFARAVRAEMRQLRRRRDHPLRVKALARVVVFAVIWAAGAIALHILAPAGNTMDFPASPTQGRTTDVTSSLAPHPATTGSHP